MFPLKRLQDPDRLIRIVPQVNKDYFFRLVQILCAVITLS